MVEHTGAEVGLHLYARTEKAYTPEETAEHHCKDDVKHGSADLLHQKVHIKGQHLTAFHYHLAAVNAVDDHTVKLGDLQLKKVYEQKRQNAEYEHVRVFEIVFVNVFSENQILSLLS